MEWSEWIKWKTKPWNNPVDYKAEPEVLRNVAGDSVVAKNVAHTVQTWVDWTS